MIKRFFDPEGFAWKPFGIIADIFVLSLLWLLCSLPLVTIGAATAALYDAAVRGIRQNQPGAYGRFWRTFKRELRLSLLCWLLWGGLLLLFVMALRLFTAAAEASALNFTVAVAGLTLLLLPTGFACWVFPLLSRFSFDFMSLNRSALGIAAAHILSTLAIAASALFTVWLCIRLIMPVFFMPALLMLFWSIFMERAFKKYLPSEDE